MSDSDDLDELERLDQDRDRRRRADLPEWQQPLRVSRAEGEMPAPGPGPARPIYTSEIYRGALLAPGVFHFVLVDVDNLDGFYPHRGGLKATIFAAQSELEKARSNDLWEFHLAVVTRIDATSADLELIRFGGLHLRTPLRQQVREIANVYPFGVDLDVRGGELANVAASQKILGEIAVNTATPLEGPDPAELVTPAVGDVLIRVEADGNQNALVHVAAQYSIGGDA